MEEEKVIEKKPIRRKKVKTWGDNGFVGKIQYGCYEYTVKFLPEAEVVKVYRPDSVSKNIRCNLL